MRDALVLNTVEDRVHRTKAADGWPISLHEYRPRGERQPGPPILMVHGTFSCANIWDLGGGIGLAPWLAERGFHCFALNLRGRGLSLPRGARERAWALFQKGWTFDDFVKFDIPAAIGRIRALTGAKQVDYVGHSMGGMIVYTCLALSGDKRVRRVITVGTPWFENRPGENPPEIGGKRFDLIRATAPLFNTLPIIPIQSLARLAALAGEKTTRRYISAGFNPANVDPDVARRYLWHGVISVSSKKFRRFQKLAGGIEDPSGHRITLADYTHPTLFVAGERDRLCPPWMVERAFAMAASPEKEFINFSRGAGFSADYGHGDLLIGREADREVFPVLQRWLTGQPLRD